MDENRYIFRPDSYQKELFITLNTVKKALPACGLVLFNCKSSAYGFNISNFVQLKKENNITL